MRTAQASIVPRATLSFLALWVWIAVSIVPVLAQGDAEVQLVASEPIVLRHPAINDSAGNPVHCLRFTERDASLATGAASGVFVWDVAKGELRHSLKVDERGVDCLAVEPGGAFLVAGGATGVIKIWDTRTWKEVRSLGPTPAAVRALAVSPDGKLLASASPDGQKGEKDPDFGVVLWELATGNKLRTLPLPPPALGTTALAFSRDGKTVIAAQDRTVRVLDVQSGEVSRTAPLRGVVRSLGSMALRPDGLRLATGIFEPRIRIWNTESWEQALAWDAHEQEKPPRQGVVTVGYSPDGQYVLSGGMDGMVCVWQSSSGRRLLQLDARHQSSGWVTGVAMSSDGGMLAAAHTGGTATIWRIGTRTKK